MYEFEKIKQNVNRILKSKTKVEHLEYIPKDESILTYENGVEAWVTAIFVDIYNSSKLFKNGKKDIVSRVIRSFTSEIIKILKSDSNYRDIGIRGDCVYGIYSTPTKNDIKNIYELAVDINTFLNMFSKILEENSFPNVIAGIGIGCSYELVVKSGLKQSGINDYVWIGDAVVDACKLSEKANRNGLMPIMLTGCVYNNIIDIIKKEYGVDKSKSWFSKIPFDDVYQSDVLYNDYEEWL